MPASIGALVTTNHHSSAPEPCLHDGSGGGVVDRTTASPFNLTEAPSHANTQKNHNVGFAYTTPCLVAGENLGVEEVGGGGG